MSKTLFERWRKLRNHVFVPGPSRVHSHHLSEKRDAGGFRVGPADVNVPAARRYIPGTMVLETSWETRLGWVIVRDALSMGPWHHAAEHERFPR